MSDQQFAKMEDLNPKEPGSNLKTDDSRERTINIVVGIFSFIVPFLGFILTCVYWSTNRFRSWLCFGLGWIPTITLIVFVIIYAYVIYSVTHDHDD